MIDENAAVFLERGKEFEQPPVPVVSQRCVCGPVRRVHAFGTLDCIHPGMNRIFLLDLSGPVGKLLTVCLCGCGPGRLVSRF